MDDLVSLINKELLNYDATVDEVMQDEVNKLSNEVLSDLKTNTDIPVRRGRYKRSFYVKHIVKRKGASRCVIANREYRLTHLLEDGHDITHDGKTVGRTRAFPHWEKAQQKADTLLERITRRLEQI